MLVNADLKTLKEKIKTQQLVVGVFTTKWCGECIMTHKVLPEVKKVKPEVTFIEVDVDREKLWENESKENINIKFVPTFIIYKNGIEVARDSGFKVEKKLIKFINKHE